MGFVLLKILNLPGRWSQVLLGFLFILPIVLNVPNLKNFLLGVLALSFSMDLDITFFRVVENPAGAHQFGVGISDAVIFILYFLWMNEQFSQNNFKIRIFPKTTIPFLIFIIYSMLTSYWAPTKELVWLEVAQLIRLFFLYFYVVNNVKHEAEFRIIMWILVISLFAQGTIGCFQKITGRHIGLDFLGESFRVHQGGGRVSGTLGHPNKLASYIGLLLPSIVCFFFLARNKLPKLIVAASLGFGMILLILTGSRGGFISVSLALPLTIFLLFKKNVIKPGAVFVVLGFVVLITIATVIPMKEQIEARVASKVGRLEMIEVAMSVIKGNPFLGVGVNNYQERMQEYDRTYIRTTFHFDRPVHSLYFLILAEMGLIGFIIFIWLVGSILITAFQNIKHTPYFQTVLNIGILAGILAFLTYGLAEKHLPSESSLFFYLAAIAVGGSQFRTRSQEKTSIVTDHHFGRRLLGSRQILE